MKLTLTGSKSVDIGTSCSSLKKTGFYKSGYYNIKTVQDMSVKSVFCDMESGNYDDVPDVDDVMNYAPIGTILPWVPTSFKWFIN